MVTAWSTHSVLFRHTGCGGFGSRSIPPTLLLPHTGDQRVCFISLQQAQINNNYDDTACAEREIIERIIQIFLCHT